MVVGYGETDGQKHWLLKNSWGTGWGEDGGFLKLKRGMPGTGHLGLLTQPGYPVKISPNPGQQPNSRPQPAQDLGLRRMRPLTRL